jgi:hypothetical protein
LTVPADQPGFWIGLIPPPDVNYRLYVYGPDARIAGEPVETATNGIPSVQVDIEHPVAGEYLVVVDSPRGHTDLRPYSLTSMITWLSAPATLSDGFDDPSRGWLPHYSDEPEIVTLAYQDGEYRLSLSRLGFIGYAGLPFATSEEEQLTISVDARVASFPDNEFILVYCRSSDFERYELWFEPSERFVQLGRVSADEWVQLGSTYTSAAAPLGIAVDRVELSCVGDRMAGSVNGVEVVSARDPTYVSGGLGVGAGTYVEATSTVDVRFDNLLVVIAPDVR